MGSEYKIYYRCRICNSIVASCRESEDIQVLINEVDMSMRSIFCCLIGTGKIKCKACRNLIGETGRGSHYFLNLSNLISDTKV